MQLQSVESKSFQTTTVTGQSDVASFGVPYTGPFAANSVMNPILAAYSALGYCERLSTGTPLVPRWRRRHHPSPVKARVQPRPSSQLHRLLSITCSPKPPTSKTSRRITKTTFSPTNGTHICIEIQRVSRQSSVRRLASVRDGDQKTRRSNPRGRRPRRRRSNWVYAARQRWKTHGKWLVTLPTRPIHPCRTFTHLPPSWSMSLFSALRGPLGADY